MDPIDESTVLRRILNDITDERCRQDAKWGMQEHYGATWLAILVEEVGEVARAVLEKTGHEILRRELVQVAAVAVAWLERIDDKE